VTGGQDRHHVQSLRVREVIAETAEARSLIFDIPAAFRPVYAYQAGQFLTLVLEIGGRQVRRCYSLSSAPDIDPHHTVTVKRVKNGLVSNWINDHIKAGDSLSALPPSGHFVLPNEPLPLCLYAAGSGITPILSLIKTALARWSVPIALFYANRDAPSTIFARNLASLCEKHGDRLDVHWHFDDRDGPILPRYFSRSGRMPGDAVHYLCGPGPYMALAEEALLDAGVGASRILSERFLSPDNPDDHMAPQSAEGTAAMLTVVIDGCRHEVTCASGETILAAARRAGLNPPSACEQGSCGSCIAKIAGGTATMRHNDVLNAQEIAEGLVLTCQAEPCSDRLIVEF
jgi:3-ketosteroid 9alpha-monooxygenase subunit B